MEKFHQKEHYKLIFHSASMLKSFKKIHIEFSSLLDSPEISNKVAVRLRGWKHIKQTLVFSTSKENDYDRF